MKLRTLLGILFALFMVVASAAAQGFEGTIDMEYSTFEGTDMDLSTRWYVKGEQVAFEIGLEVPEQGFVITRMVPNLSNNTMLIYSDQPTENGEFVYFEVSAADIQGDNKYQLDGEVERSDETKEIAGYECEKLIAYTENTVTEIWVATGLNISMHKYASFFKDNYELPALQSAGINGMPLEVVTKDALGKTISAYKTMLVESTALEQSEFSIPEGYKNAKELY